MKVIIGANAGNYWVSALGPTASPRTFHAHSIFSKAQEEVAIHFFCLTDEETEEESGSGRAHI